METNKHTPLPSRKLEKDTENITNISEEAWSNYYNAFVDPELSRTLFKIKCTKPYNR
jgi:hypothetical protein